MSLSAGAPAAYACSAAASGVCSWALVRWRHRIPLVDVPNARSSHRQPKPRSGGLALAVGVSVGLGVSALVGGAGAAASDAVPTLAGAAAFFLLGLLDDVLSLPEWTRLLAQTAIAGAVVARGPSIRELTLPALEPVLLPRGLAAAFSVAWCVGFVNAFNFMDGTDGIAAGAAAVAGLAMALLGAGPLPLFASSAALGFLAMNYEPARIFMGDGGSYLLGYILAISAVTRGGERGAAPPFEAFALVLGTFIADTSLTLLRRVYRGEKWFKAHRTHYYQRLTDLGWSHARVFWANLLATAGLAASAFAYAAEGPRLRAVLVAGWLAALFLGTRWVHAQESAGRRAL